MNHSGSSPLNLHPASHPNECKSGARWPRARREEEVTSDNGPPRLVIRTCRHILDGGAFCLAAAVGGRAYCRAHLQLRTQLSKMARACRRAGFLKLPPLTDLQTVQAGMVKLQVALAGGHLDDGRARLLRYGLRQMAADFRFLEQLRQAPARPAQRQRTHVSKPISPSSSIRYL